MWGIQSSSAAVVDNDLLLILLYQAGLQYYLGNEISKLFSKNTSDLHKLIQKNHEIYEKNIQSALNAAITWREERGGRNDKQSYVRVQGALPDDVHDPWEALAYVLDKIEKGNANELEVIQYYMLKLSGYDDENINKNKPTHRSRERREARTKPQPRERTAIDEYVLRDMIFEEQLKFEEMVKKLGLEDFMINETDIDEYNDLEQEQET
jgi:hypothetical protein